jgi:hypothetical protein
MDRTWFETMAADARTRPDVYSKLGFADLRLVVEEVDGATAHAYGLVLDGYDVIATGPVEDVAAFGADAVLTGPREAWDEMAANIVVHEGADGAHTLNSLTIAETPLRVISTDPMGRDKFFRYAETLQTLFDSLLSVQVAA